MRLSRHLSNHPKIIDPEIFGNANLSAPENRLLAMLVDEKWYIWTFAAR